MYLPARVRHISDSNLMAIYLWSCALKNQANTIIISNAFLRKWFDVSRVYAGKAEKFGRAMSLFFPVANVGEDDRGRTILKVQVVNNLSLRDSKRVTISEFPSFEEIEKALGFDVYLLKADKG